MNRKNFLSSVLGMGAALPATASLIDSPVPGRAFAPLLVPAYLQPGDTIGITCPAGFITLKEIQPAIQQIESWGFKIKVGDTVGKKDGSFGGTDAERAA